MQNVCQTTPKLPIDRYTLLLLCRSCLQLYLGYSNHLGETAYLTMNIMVCRQNVFRTSWDVRVVTSYVRYVVCATPKQRSLGGKIGLF